MFKHAENTMAAHPRTLDFSARSEFLVATGFVGEMSVLMNAHPLIGPSLAELFMQVVFAGCASLGGPSARWSRR